MDDLELPDPHEDLESPEPIVISLDNLHPHCRDVIFKLLPLRDLLRLRSLCRSLNDAVLDHRKVRTLKKLAFFLDVDREGTKRLRMENSEPVLEYHSKVKLNVRASSSSKRSKLPQDTYWFRQLNPIRIRYMDTIPWDRMLLRSQAHFRSEDFIYIAWPEQLAYRKMASLTLFMTNHCPEVTHFALLINRAFYFRYLAKLLTPLVKLKVLLVDLTRSPKSGVEEYPGTDILDAISGMPELEYLYYLRSNASRDIFELENFIPPDPFTNGNFQMLSNGENFLEVVLPRLKVLHAHGLTFPVRKIFEKLEEVSLSKGQEANVVRNQFPVLKKLITSEFIQPTYALQRGGALVFENVKVLELHGWSISIYNYVVELLNELPNLEELHCSTMIRYTPQPVVIQNHNIARFYSEIHPVNMENQFKLPVVPEIAVSGQQMNEYVAECKEVFPGLRMFSNQRPEMVVEFPPDEIP